MSHFLDLKKFRHQKSSFRRTLLFSGGEYDPTAPPGYATVGSELTETDNESPFRVFKFLTPKMFFRRTFPFSGGSVRSPWLRHCHLGVAGSGADPCSTLGGGGGIIPHFYRFFGILKFWGGYSGFADFSSFNDFENLGVYSGLTKMYLNN